MSSEALRWLARAHAIAAWVSTIAIGAAAWAMFHRPPSRRRAFAVGALATGAISIAFMLGLLLDDAYRARIRQRLFVMAPDLGWLFERKEHLAFGALLFGWSGLLASGAAALLAMRAGRGPEGERAAALSSELGRAARVACTAAALLTLAACLASAIVARRVHF